MRELLQQDHEESERHEGAERDELLHHARCVRRTATKPMRPSVTT